MTLVLDFIILVCDQPPESLLQRHGDYVALFTRLIQQTFNPNQTPLSQDSHSTTQLGTISSVDATAFKSQQDRHSERDYGQHIMDYYKQHIQPSQGQRQVVLVLTGSKASAYDDVFWIHELKRVIQQIHQINQQEYAINPIKMVGICFGHQVIAEALGGSVKKNPKGWEIGHTTLEWTGKVSNYSTFKPVMTINSMHQDMVVDAPGFDILASSFICANQAMVSHDQCIVTVQGHPEYTSDFVSGLISLRRGKVFSEELADAALAKQSLPLDGPDFFRWMVLLVVQASRSSV